MTARLHRAGDARAFQPEGHTGVSPVRLTGTAPEETISVVLSNYEPGAHAERSPVPVDTVYVVLTGRLTVSLENDHRLREDSIENGFCADCWLFQSTF